MYPHSPSSGTLRCAPSHPLHAFSSASAKSLIGFVHMLEPGREADKPFGDANLARASGVQDASNVRRGRRMGGGTSWHRQDCSRCARSAARCEAAERGRLAALHLEADQGRAGAHLLLHQCCLRMIGAAGIDQPRDLRMLRPAHRRPWRRSRAARRTRTAQRLQALQQHPGVERRQRRARSGA